MDKLIPFDIEIDTSASSSIDRMGVNEWLEPLNGQVWTVAGTRNNGMEFLLLKRGEVTMWLPRDVCKVV